MKIGIDSFAAVQGENGQASTPDQRAETIEHLLTRIELMEHVGLDVFGLGEHHRPEYLDSSPLTILAAAAARTSKIELLSAVTVLSAQDPVRVFQQLATLDIISKGRAGLVAGRGSFSEAFPLFGLSFKDYDDLFEEKLELLLQLRAEEKVNWEGRFRPALTGQGVYPRPYQAEVPIYIGVGGTPASFARAGRLGLPLMIAIIGGQTHRFKPLVDLYYRAGEEAGHPREKLNVAVHSLGYVSQDSATAHEEFFPGYAKTFTQIGKERGWGGPVTRRNYDAQSDELGALVVGNPEEVAEKIIRHSKALGDLAEFRFHMNVAHLSHEQMVNAIELLGNEVAPRVKEALA
ncbi:MAG: Atu2307/SP_0267 family LLM class monooxygenase [Bacteroidota bacterium]